MIDLQENTNSQNTQVKQFNEVINGTGKIQRLSIIQNGIPKVEGLSDGILSAPEAIVLIKVNNVSLVVGYFEGEYYNFSNNEKLQRINQIIATLDRQNDEKKRLSLLINENLITIENDTPLTTRDFVFIYWENESISSLISCVPNSLNYESLVGQYMSTNKKSKKLFKGIIRSLISSNNIPSVFNPSTTNNISEHKEEK